MYDDPFLAMITLFMMVHPLELISELVLTSNVKSTLVPGVVGLGLFVDGDPVSLLPQAPRQEVISNEPAPRPNEAKKSFRSIIIKFDKFLWFNC